MKKITLLAAFLGIFAVSSLASPWPSYAGGTQFSIGFNIRVGTPHVIVRHPVWVPPKVYYWRGPVAVAPYFYYRIPSVIIVEKAPVYVPSEQTQEKYWYYCPDSQAYYPDVKSCPGGWLKVIPPTTPPDAEPRP